MPKENESQFEDAPMNEEVQLDDFNIDEEARPEPLVPQGNYYGSVIEVSLKGAAIVWKIVLDPTGGCMSDGETPISGAHIYTRNWMPVAGDESKATASGRNKRQTKINMMKRFADLLKIKFGSMEQIKESIENQEWVGIPVLCKVVIKKNDMTGELQNEIQKMERASKRTAPASHDGTETEMPTTRRRSSDDFIPQDDIPF